jgi:hypothetical protein
MTRVRARPFLHDMQPITYGPHDLLGFRNYAVPGVVDGTPALRIRRQHEQEKLPLEFAVLSGNTFCVVQ